MERAPRPRSVVGSLGRRVVARRARAPMGIVAAQLARTVSERRRPSAVIRSITRLTRGRPTGRHAFDAPVEPVPQPPGMSEFAARWLFGDGSPEGIPFGEGAALDERPDLSGPPSFMVPTDEPSDHGPPLQPDRPVPRGQVQEVPRSFRLSRTPVPQPAASIPGERDRDRDAAAETASVSPEARQQVAEPDATGVFVDPGAGSTAESASPPSLPTSLPPVDTPTETPAASGPVVEGVPSRRSSSQPAAPRPVVTLAPAVERSPSAGASVATATSASARALDEARSVPGPGASSTPPSRRPVLLRKPAAPTTPLPPMVAEPRAPADDAQPESATTPATGLLQRLVSALRGSVGGRPATVVPDEPAVAENSPVPTTAVKIDNTETNAGATVSEPAAVSPASDALTATRPSRRERERVDAPSARDRGDLDHAAVMPVTASTEQPHTRAARPAATPVPRGRLLRRSFDRVRSAAEPVRDTHPTPVVARELADPESIVERAVEPEGRTPDTALPSLPSIQADDPPVHEQSVVPATRDTTASLVPAVLSHRDVLEGQPPPRPSVRAGEPIRAAPPVSAPESSGTAPPRLARRPAPPVSARWVVEPTIRRVTAARGPLAEQAAAEAVVVPETAPPDEPIAFAGPVARGPRAILREESETEPPEATTTPEAPTPPPPAGRPPEQSPDDLYEHVVARLRRDLLVERERMGDLLGDLP